LKALLLCDFLPSLNDVYLQLNKTLAQIFFSHCKKRGFYFSFNGGTLDANTESDTGVCLSASVSALT